MDIPKTIAVIGVTAIALLGVIHTSEAPVGNVGNDRSEEVRRKYKRGEQMNIDKVENEFQTALREVGKDLRANNGRYYSNGKRPVLK